MIKPIDIGISTEQRQQIADEIGRLLADNWILDCTTDEFLWVATPNTTSCGTPSMRLPSGFDLWGWQHPVATER